MIESIVQSAPAFASLPLIAYPFALSTQSFDGTHHKLVPFCTWHKIDYLVCLVHYNLDTVLASARLMVVCPLV
jgi:hypothetical protein